jgi:hypothetical protein
MTVYGCSLRERDVVVTQLVSARDVVYDFVLAEVADRNVK